MERPRHLHLVGRPSERYIAARETDRGRETEVPQVKIYNPNVEEDRRGLMHSILTLPERTQRRPWKADVNDPEAVFNEAVEEGVFIDRFPEYLEDKAKRKKGKAHFDKYIGQDPEHPKESYLMNRYKSFNDTWENSRVVEFTWEEGIKRYERIPVEEEYHWLVHLSDSIIIPDEAREALPKKRIAFAGAGVGSSLIEGAVRAGAKNITVADGGAILYHDLNRLQAPDITTVGDNHAADAIKKAYKANPYIDAQCYTQNITPDGKNGTVSIDTFLNGSDIVFEEIDNLQMKILIREAALARGIPVIMATDVGMGTIIDYQHLKPGDSTDLIFPGLTRDEYNRIKSGERLTFEESTDFAVKMVGEEVSYWRDGVENGLHFWSQTGASADASKSKAAHTLAKWSMGQEIPPRQVYLEPAA